MTYTVYIAVNIANGKRYIGVTGKGIKKRAKKHLAAARSGASQCPKFHRALLKHGPKNFVWKALFVTEVMAEAYAMERTLVEAMKPEYNVAAGGRSPAGWNKRAILCLEDGLRHDSAMDASDFYSIDLSEICKVLRGERRWAKNLHFCYLDAVSDSAKRRASMISEIDDKFIRAMRRVPVRKECRSAPVGGLDASGRSAAGPISNMRKVMCVQDGIVFDSVSDASRHYDLDTGSISRICNGIRKFAGGRSFTFVDAAPEAIN